MLAYVNSDKRCAIIQYMEVIAGIIGAFVGFCLSVVFERLKSPNLKIVSVSGLPYQIAGSSNKIPDTGFKAYRIRVENKQKRFLNQAAKNCIAWIELDSAQESCQVCWVGGSSITINVGDFREVDFVARGDTTGTIIAPTERGYFEPDPRLIGDGKSALQGKLRITCKNGKRTEKPFRIKPNGNQLEITILDRGSKEKDMVSSSSGNSDAGVEPLRKEIEGLKEELRRSNKEGKFRFHIGIGLALMAIGIGVQFSPIGSVGRMPNSIFALLFYILGFVQIIEGLASRDDLKGIRKHIINIGCSILLLGATMVSIPFLGEFNLPSWLIPIGILIAAIGGMLMEVSLIRFRKN